MDATKAKVIKTEKKTEWTERIGKNTEICSVNEEKNMVIERYENVLSLLKRATINEDDLVNIKKPLDELESYLKLIPNGPLFNDVIPTEIKDRILSLSCPSDTNAFIAASVCEDWKMILERRFQEQKMIILSETDENEEAAELMRAAAVHKLDVHLVIDKPVTEVDSKLITEALTSVSKFTVTNNLDYNDDVEVLSDEQFDHLFASMEKGEKIMDEVNLINLDLTRINQEKLINCLVTKTKRLTLESPVYTDNGMLERETFISKLLQDSANLKLSHLTFRDLDLFQNADEMSCTNMVNALCKVENVVLVGHFHFTSPIAIALTKNILEKPIVMKTLIIDSDYITNFRELFSPQDLKFVFTKMTTLQMIGEFTMKQLEAVDSLSDVDVECVNFFGSEFHTIKKGSIESI